jgi:hypothetical protein
MKVLSLLQPWATLVVIGAKKIETRSWSTKYRGPLLIHASKKMGREQKELIKSFPFWEALQNLKELPLGKIIGYVNLDRVISTNDGILKDAVGNEERDFGDYSPNRYGWLLSKPAAFTNLFPAKGSLGLWDFDYRICRQCGCTDVNCTACVEKTGQPCSWVKEDLCSACVQ